jgi:hypothetical protein
MRLILNNGLSLLLLLRLILNNGLSLLLLLRLILNKAAFASRAEPGVSRCARRSHP